MSEILCYFNCMVKKSDAATGNSCQFFKKNSLRHLCPDVHESLECGNMPKDTKQYQQPAQQRQPAEDTGEHKADDTDYENQYEPVRSTEQPAIIPSDTYSLCLSTEV